MRDGAENELDRELLPSYNFQVWAYDSPLDASVRLRTTVPVSLLC